MSMRAIMCVFKTIASIMLLVLAAALHAPTKLRGIRWIHTCMECGNAPFGDDVVIYRQPLQRGVERAFTDFQRVIGNLLNVLGDSVSVVCATAERLENQHLQSAGQEVGLR